MEYFKANEENKLKSEYEYKMQKLSDALTGLSTYCCKLDGHKSKLHEELIKIIQNDFEALDMGKVNIHEASMTSKDLVKSIKSDNLRYKYNSYKSREDFISELMQFLTEEDISFSISYECPLYELTVSLDKCRLLIRNTPDETMEVYWGTTRLLETRDMSLVINQIRFTDRITQL